MYEIPEAHYHLHKSLALDIILQQDELFYTITPYFLTIHFNIIILL
jgi:hypothetical protein